MILETVIGVLIVTGLLFLPFLFSFSFSIYMGHILLWSYNLGGYSEITLGNYSGGHLGMQGLNLGWLDTKENAPSMVTIALAPGILFLLGSLN